MPLCFLPSLRYWPGTIAAYNILTQNFIPVFIILLRFSRVNHRILFMTVPQCDLLRVSQLIIKISGPFHQICAWGIVLGFMLPYRAVHWISRRWFLTHSLPGSFHGFADKCSIYVTTLVYFTHYLMIVLVILSPEMGPHIFHALLFSYRVWNWSSSLIKWEKYV